MLNRNHRIATLLCLSITATACDVDERPEGLDAFEQFDDDALDAGDDAGDAQAAPQSDLDLSLAPAPAGDHCIVEATAVPYGVDPATVRAADNPVKCYPTFADAIFAATGERIADDVTPDTYEPVDQFAAGPTAGTPRASYVVGIVYQYSNWKGKSLSIVTSGTCLTASWILNKFSDSWWDDRVSSTKAYSGCKHSYHYEKMYLGGAVKDCGTSCWYVGAALQNRTSSLRFTK